MPDMPSGQGPATPREVSPPSAPQVPGNPPAASVSSPTRREMRDWIVEYCRERNPPESGSVPWGDLETLLGESHETVAFARSTHAAIMVMLDDIPPLFFRQDARLGLVRVSLEEFTAEAIDRRGRAEASIRVGMKILNACSTQANRLTPEQLAENDRERLRQIHLMREMTRVKSRRWIEQSAPPDPKALE
jgi:hypothetical protein